MSAGAFWTAYLLVAAACFVGLAAVAAQQIEDEEGPDARSPEESAAWLGALLGLLLAAALWPATLLAALAARKPR